MAKIAYIGAGSVNFAPNLIGDVLTNRALTGSHLALMDVNADNLDVSLRYAKKLAAQVGSYIKLEATTDLSRALEGADYVFETTLKQGEARVREERTCQKHGLYLYSGCTTGPAGVFRALREIPATLDILRVMEKVCPKAYYLHYANPTNTVSLALSKASPIKSVGLCHSVEGTAKTMAHYLGAPFKDVAHWAAGVNHQAWILRFERDGEDLYPQFRALYNDKKIYEKDKVRFEIMDYFGYFPTESSPHNSEYVPYFRRTLAMAREWASQTAHTLNQYGGIDQEGSLKTRAAKREVLLKSIESVEPVVLRDHDEYCIRVIAAMMTGEAFCFNGNVPNNGLITNLPPDLCVEVPILADRTGLHPCFVGRLPDQCAALNASRCAGDLLAVKGALEGDKKAIEQAVALDPLTAAVLTLDQIKKLVADLFEADKEYLPQFE